MNGATHRPGPARARACEAHQHLAGVGVDRVHVLDGGLTAYTAAVGARDATVVDGRARWALERQVRRVAGHITASAADRATAAAWAPWLGYLRPFRAEAAAPPAVPRPPTVRDVVGLLLRHPDTLDADDQFTLKQVRECCPHLDDVADHVSGFAEMMAGRHGERLDAWISQIEADDQPDFHRFANGVRRDYDAVLNGLTLEHSSGAVEESVNRIKMIKRQMYGRAGFELFRKRVLLAG